MSRRRTVPPALLASALALVVAMALAAAARTVPAEPDEDARCARIGTDDALRPVPPGWVDAIRVRLGLPELPPQLVARGTVWRCESGRVLVCFTGANLPCGKLDQRTALLAVDTWCAQHANAPIPADVIGHDSLWRWQCDGARAIRDGQAWQPDPRGFARATWHPLTPPN